jgi:hypothetical protein
MPYGELRVDTITFTNGGVDTSITVSGLAAIVAATTGNLTVTGTVSGTAANFISGAFSTEVSGLTVIGTTGTFTSLTGTTFTATTGTFTTVTGGTGTFTTVTGGTGTFTSGVFASGSATNPSISFVGDNNTGIYASAADQVSITTSGTERLRIDPAGQIESVSLGTATAPAYSFTTDPNTGIYSPDADQIAISTSGTERVRVDSSGRLLVGTSTGSGRITVAGNSVGVLVALTDASTVDVDMSLANHFTLTLGGNRTLANPSNLTAGQAGCIWITQDGTGSRTLAYGSQWDFTGGTAPTLTTAANSVDCLVYAVQSSTRITATLVTNLS